MSIITPINKSIFPNEATLVCQGAEGAFSQVAAKVLFPTVVPNFLPSFSDVFAAVSAGQYKYGILPIENSSAGSVTDVYDLFSKYKTYIVRSVKIAIEHCLLGHSGAHIYKLSEIHTHEQAGRQCSEFLAGLPNARLVLCANTAVAAKTVATGRNKNIAAIASGSCAELYGLSVLERGIQNNSRNYTRFVCISKDCEVFSNADRISIMLNLKHEPGALYAVIKRFADYGINLTKIESRPIVGTDFEFSFYFDIQAGLSDPRVESLIFELSKSCKKLAFLGNYSEICANQ